MKRRIVTFLLAVTVIFTLAVTASAKRDVTLEESCAVKLKELGLFYGVGENDFDLERAPTRIEALIMLIRVLGVEDKALGGEWKHPFTDVPSWADKYVGYAYENKLANGVSLNRFGTSNATSAQYLTFMLRALGYSDTNGIDFTWDNPYDLARYIGILPSTVDTENFWRADVAHISYIALGVKLKASTQTLSDKLIEAKVFTREKYSEIFSEKVVDSGNVLTPVEISEKCADAVFYIEVYSYNGRLTSSGSGFFISEDGYAITNNHVAANSRYMRITMPDGTKYDDVTLLDTDAGQDLALLKVESNSKFKFLETGDSKSVKQGQKVYAIGSPLGLDNTMSEGIISNVKRVLDNTHYIQISVPIDHGSSGGALIDEYGRVIGVTSAGYSESGSDLNLVVPIQYIELLDKNASNTTAWSESYYPLFSYVYDFGAFTGMQLAGYNTTTYGYVCVYSGADTYEVYGNDGKLKYSRDDSYKFCLEQYKKALEAVGLKYTRVSASVSRYENDLEYVEIKEDASSNKLITITAGLKPLYYPEANNFLDIGWYIGLTLESKKTNDGVTVYSYPWSDVFTATEFDILLDSYLEEVEKEYTTVYLGYGENDAQTLSLYKNNTIVGITLTTTHISLEIKKYNVSTANKNFDMISAYIKDNCTASTNTKYTISKKDAEDTYSASYSVNEGLISFAGRIVLPDSELQLYVRILKSGFGTVEAYIKSGSSQVKYVATILPGEFSSSTVLRPHIYNGRNAQADSATVAKACVVLLKKCDSLIFGDSAISLEKLGFTSLYK